MAEPLVTPRYIKYRRETDGGLVYDHEHYGVEDATLSSVAPVVIDVLTAADESGGCPRAELERRFGSDTVERLLAVGFLKHA